MAALVALYALTQLKGTLAATELVKRIVPLALIIKGAKYFVILI